MPRVQTVLGARRPGRARLGPAPRAHRDRALAYPEPLGLLGAPPRRARHRRGARRVPGGRRRHGRRPDARRRRAGIRRGSPGWPAATGLHVVMGSGWYRGAHYPAEALIDRRCVDSLADEIVRDATEGVAETGIRAGIIGEIGTDKPWISAQEERVHRAAARAARRTGLAITTHAVQSTVGLDQLDVFEAEGADLSRVVDRPRRFEPVARLPPGDRRARRDGRVRLPRDGLHAARAARRGPDRRATSASCSPAATSSGSCCRRTSATTASSAATAATATPTSPTTFLPRLREAGVSDAEIRTITVDNPRRLLTIA